MSRIRTPDVDQFTSYVESRPGRLGCWRDGWSGRYQALAWLNIESVVRFRELANEVGLRVAAGLQTPAHHNQVGIAAGWVSMYMRGRDRAICTPEQDRQALFNVAGQYWGLRNALVEVRAGVRDYHAEGSMVRLAYNGNHRVDALDRVFDMLEMLDQMRAPTPSPDPRLREWIVSHGLTRTWETLPVWVRDAYRSRASAVLATYPRELSNDVNVGGFAIGDFDGYWTELLAWGQYMHTATLLGSEYPPTVAPLVPRDAFVGQLASGAGIDQDAAARITKVLTLEVDRCPDGALTPIAPIDDQLVPMSALILPTSPQRNLLAILQRDPNAVGEVGRLLGLAGERETLATLERMASGVLFASRVKVIRRNGQPAGDLDVVVCDPRAGLLAIFEIKWHIAADGNDEVYRAEATTFRKRDQAVRLRSEVVEGEATVHWPRGWPDVSGYRQRWFVLTRDVLAMRNIADDNVTARSLQLLRRALRVDASVADLIALLDDPPEPPSELCTTQWERVRYGDMRVEIEMLVT